MTASEELVLRTAALKVISEFTRARYDEARAELGKELHRGDRLIARSPLDERKIGAVYMTEPKTECRVTDESALKAWMQERYPELCENAYEVIGSEAEVIAVLFEHAPHLLRHSRRVSSEALRELRAACVTLGAVVGPGNEADVPGLELHTPDGVVACRPADSSLQAVLDMHRAGVISLDGTVVSTLEAPRG